MIIGIETTCAAVVTAVATRHDRGSSGQLGDSLVPGASIAASAQGVYPRDQALDMGNWRIGQYTMAEIENKRSRR